MQRLDWEEIRYLIGAEKYFVLHAPRQTGKTSTLLAMMEVLNQSGEYNTLYVNIEGAQTAREDARWGMTMVCQSIAARASDYGIEPSLPDLAKSILADTDPGVAVLQNDDLQYVEDLGLIRTSPQIAISNRIYQEIIPREITWQWQATITHQQAWYLTPERRLDMVKLLTAFQQFFRENSDVWLQGLPYKEAGPHL